MLITRTSILTGIEHDRDIDISEDELLDMELNPSTSSVWDYLAAEDAEFIDTGILRQELINGMKDR